MPTTPPHDYAAGMEAAARQDLLDDLERQIVRRMRNLHDDYNSGFDTGLYAAISILRRYAKEDPQQ